MLYCTIYIVRHGQSEANAQDLYGLDLDLTEKGRQQIKQLTQALQNVKFDAIFSSPLIRAKQTAEIIALEHNLAVKTHQALRERNYDILEGRKGSEVQKELAELFEKREELAGEQRIKFKFSDNYETDE